jgi:hypothetical protein
VCTHVATLAEAVYDVTSETAEIAFVDEDDTGKAAAADAAVHGIQLEVIKHETAKGQLRAAISAVGR